MDDYEIFEENMLESLRDGDWEGACNAVLMCWHLQPYAFGTFGFYEDIPKDMQRDFAIQCYISHGDSLPGCRKAIRRLEKKGKEELPEEYRSQEWITVYRAGSEMPERAKYKISWSLSKDLLKPFIEFKKALGQDVRVYQGKIRPEDVIAYTDARAEKEILQYRNVKYVEVVV